MGSREQGTDFFPENCEQLRKNCPTTIRANHQYKSHIFKDPSGSYNEGGLYSTSTHDIVVDLNMDGSNGNSGNFFEVISIFIVFGMCGLVVL